MYRGYGVVAGGGGGGAGGGGGEHFTLRVCFHLACCVVNTRRQIVHCFLFAKPLHLLSCNFNFWLLCSTLLHFEHENVRLLFLDTSTFPASASVSTTFSTFTTFASLAPPSSIVTSLFPVTSRPFPVTSLVTALKHTRIASPSPAKYSRPPTCVKCWAKRCTSCRSTSNGLSTPSMTMVRVPSL